MGSGELGVGSWEWGVGSWDWAKARQAAEKNFSIFSI